VEEQEKTQVHHQNEQGPEGQDNDRVVDHVMESKTDSDNDSESREGNKPDHTDQHNFHNQSENKNPPNASKDPGESAQKPYKGSKHNKHSQLGRYEHTLYSRTSSVSLQRGAPATEATNKLLKETMKEVAQSEEDKKDKESSSQDENHDPPEEVEQKKEQENLATSDVCTLIRTGKTPKSKYIEDRINKVAGKTEQDALKTIVKDKNSLTIRYKKEDLKYDLDKFLTWTKAPLGNSDSSKEDIVRTLVFRAVTPPTTKAEHLPMAATVTDNDHLTWAQASKSTRKAK
jgi:hypothetical protein